MKTTSKEELNFIKKLPNKKIEAVHRWHTGHQVLVFDSMTEFEKAKKAVESKPRKPL